MKNIVIMGVGGVGNLGERAIMLGTLQRIAQMHDDYDLHVMGYDNLEADELLSEAFAAQKTEFYQPLVRGGMLTKLWQIGLTVLLPAVATRKYAQFLNRDSMIVLKGQESFTAQYGTMHFIDSWLDMLLASRISAQTHVMSHSVDVSLVGWKKWVTRAVLRRMQTVELRDKASHAFVKSLGIACEYVDDCAVDAVTSYRSKKSKPKKKKYDVVVVPNITLYRSLNSDVYDRALREQIEKYQSDGRSITLMSSVATSDWNNDYEIIDRLASEYDLAVEKPLQLGDLLDLIDSAKLVISSRLHPVILSIALKTDVIGLTNAQKTIAYLQDHDQGDRVVTIPEDM